MLVVEQRVDTVAEEEREQDPTKVLECKLGRREEEEEEEREEEGEEEREGGRKRGEKKEGEKGEGKERSRHSNKKEHKEEEGEGTWYIQDSEQKLPLETIKAAV